MRLPVESMCITQGKTSPLQQEQCCLPLEFHSPCPLRDAREDINRSAFPSQRPAEGALSCPTQQIHVEPGKKSRNPPPIPLQDLHRYRTACAHATRFHAHQ